MSIASEFIENNGEDAEAQKGMSEEKGKQDRETKAFKRLARKLKEAFPRLGIIILADSLYASEPVMDICRDNKWDFIIRYKSGSILSVIEEYSNMRSSDRLQLIFHPLLFRLSDIPLIHYCPTADMEVTDSPLLTRWHCMT